VKQLEKHAAYRRSRRNLRAPSPNCFRRFAATKTFFHAGSDIKMVDSMIQIQLSLCYVIYYCLSIIINDLEGTSEYVQSPACLLEMLIINNFKYYLMMLCYVMAHLHSVQPDTINSVVRRYGQACSVLFNGVTPSYLPPIRVIPPMAEQRL